MSKTLPSDGDAMHIHYHKAAIRGCSHLAIQDHNAVVRYETAIVGSVESQLASGLQPVMLTRMVP